MFATVGLAFFSRPFLIKKGFGSWRAVIVISSQCSCGTNQFLNLGGSLITGLHKERRLHGSKGSCFKNPCYPQSNTISLTLFGWNGLSLQSSVLWSLDGTTDLHQRLYAALI